MKYGLGPTVVILVAFQSDHITACVHAKFVSFLSVFLRTVTLTGYVFIDEVFP